MLRYVPYAKVCPLCYKVTSLLGIATGVGKPAVFSKWVPWSQVGLPNLDTAHNCVPLLRYHRYKWVFQLTIFGQQNQIHTYNYHKYFFQIL